MSSPSPVRIPLSPPKIVCPDLKPGFCPDLTPYVQGLENLWKTGQIPRQYVPLSLEEFRSGYLARVLPLPGSSSVWDQLEEALAAMETVNDAGAESIEEDLEELAEELEEIKQLQELTRIEKKYKRSFDTGIQLLSALLHGSQGPPGPIRGTYGNFGLDKFCLLPCGTKPPIPIIRFSDGADGDRQIEAFHYPQPTPDGGWTVAEYVPLTDNYCVSPDGYTIEAEYTYNNDRWYYYMRDVDHVFDEIEITPTCDEFALVFTPCPAGN
jgi:hypothetical protein